MAAVVASSSSADDGTVFGEPDFAVVCSFLLKFGDLCGVNDFSVDFLQLQRMLEDTRTVHSDLIELHVRLMRRCGRRHVTHDKWELALVKFCHTYSKVDAWEIERFGYKKSKLSVKVNLLKRLLESQFDVNGKLKTEVNKLTADELRTVPIGKDVRGQLYWFQVDADLNLRVYREDQDEETFELVVREREDLITLIENLVTNTNLGAKKEEDSTTPSDTGDSKDGEGSQEGNRATCVKTTEIDEKVEDSALFPILTDGLKVKNEPEEHKVDINTEDVQLNLVKEEKIPEQSEQDASQQADKGLCLCKSTVEAELPPLSLDCDLKSVPSENKNLKSDQVSSAAEFPAPVLVPPPIRSSVIKMVATAEKCLSVKTRDRVDDIRTEVSPEPVAVDTVPMHSAEVGVGVNTAFPVSLPSPSPAVLADVPAVLGKTAPSANDKMTNVVRLSMPFKKRGIPNDLSVISDDCELVTVATKDVSNEISSSAHQHQEERLKVDYGGSQIRCEPSTSGFAVSARLNADHSAEIMEFMLKIIEDDVLVDSEDRADYTPQESDETKSLSLSENKKETEIESVPLDSFSDEEFKSEECVASVLAMAEETVEAPKQLSVTSEQEKLKPVILETKETDSYKCELDKTPEVSECDVSVHDTPATEPVKSPVIVPDVRSDNIDTTDAQDVSQKVTDRHVDVDVDAAIVAECVEMTVAAVSSAVDKEREAETEVVAAESKTKSDERVISLRSATAVRGKPGRPRGRASRGKGRICVTRSTIVAKTVVAEDKMPVCAGVVSKESTSVESSVDIVAVADVQPKKRMRGRPRASQLVVAAAAAAAAAAVASDASAVTAAEQANSEKVFDGSKPERIQPKRSCRVEAQRVKDAEEHRRIEEALQREAMLVQQRLHDERKRKDGVKGAAKSKAAATASSGSAAAVSQMLPTNGQVKQGGRRRKNAKAAPAKPEVKAMQLKEVKNTLTMTGRKKRGKLKNVRSAVAPPTEQSPATTNGNGGRTSKKRRSCYKPWDLSSESSSASASCAEEYDGMGDVEESDEELVFNDASDHEFSPESDSDRGDETWKPAQVKRARTVRRAKSDGDEGSTGESDDDKPCSKCEKYDHPEWILLCDKCDNGFHASCLRPPLMLIPDGDWFCPPCDHKMLVEKLQEQLKNLDQLWKKKEREEMRKKRLAYVGISLDNVLKPEKHETEDEDHDEGDEEDGISGGGGGCDYLRKRSRRARKEVSYRFKEFDELIDSAIQNETGFGDVLAKSAVNLGEPPAGDLHVKKHLPTSEVRKADPSTCATKVENQYADKDSRFNDEIDSADKDSDQDSELDADELVVVPVKQKKKHRRLNDLDSPSDDDDSDEDFKGSVSESENPSEEESAAGAEDTDDSWKDGGRRRRFHSRRCTGGRRQSDDDFIADDSEESEDTPRTYRRAAAKSVNYREMSDSDDGRRGSKKKRLDSWHSIGRRPTRIDSGDDDDDDDNDDDDDDSTSSDDSDWKKKRKKMPATKKSRANKSSLFEKIKMRRHNTSRTIESDDDGDSVDESCDRQNRHVRSKSAKSYEEMSDDNDDSDDDDDSECSSTNKKKETNKNKKPRLDVKDFELDSSNRSEDDDGDDDDDEEDEEEEEGDESEMEEDGEQDQRQIQVKSKRKRVVCVDESDDDDGDNDDKVVQPPVAKDTAPPTNVEKCRSETKPASAHVGDDNETSKLSKKNAEVDCSKVACAEENKEESRAANEEPNSTATTTATTPVTAAVRDESSYSVIKSVGSVKKELLLKQTPKRSSQTRTFPSSQPQPQPPTTQQQQQQHQQQADGPAPVPSQEHVDSGSLQKLESLAKGPPSDDTQSYQERLRTAPDYHSNRPSPLKPSIVESTTFPVRSCPSKLMLLDSGSSGGGSGGGNSGGGGFPVSPKLTALEPYNASQTSPYERPTRQPPQFHHHQAPPEYGPYSPVVPGQYYSPGAHQYGYQTNPYPQYPQHQQPQQQQHSPNYSYMSHGYDQGPYPPGSHHPAPPPPPYGNYLSPTTPPLPPPTVAISTAAAVAASEQLPSPTNSSSPPPSSQVAVAASAAVQPSSSSQSNGRFSIENLLQRRIEGAAAGEDDEFSTVNDLVSYITGSNSHDSQI